MQKPKLLVLQPNANFLDFLKLLEDDFEITRVDMHIHPLFRPLQIAGESGVRAIYNQARRAAFRNLRIGRLCNRFDLVFCEFLERAVATVSHVSRVPVVVRLHAYEINQPTNLIDPVNWSNIASLVVVSDEYRKQAAKLIPLPATVIYNGVDLDAFKFRPSNTGTICTYGYHRLIKRFYDLILALRDYELHIGGEGECTRTLKEATARFGLRHHFYGQIPHETVPDWLCGKEYYINHSMEESFGVAIVEAMAAGVIALCHDYPAAREILPDIYRYRYNEDLIEKLRFFLSLSTEQRLEHKLTQRRIVEEKFDVRLEAEKFRKLFDEVSSKK